MSTVTHLARRVIMVAPQRFGYNAQTAVNNVFQRAATQSDEEIAEKAHHEWLALGATLRSRGVEVLAYTHPNVNAVDSIFPNNWLSVFPSTAVLWPMQATNRRIEADQRLLDKVWADVGKRPVLDLREHAESGRFLEGTGSVVFDHAARVAYAALSPRTHADMVQEVVRGALGYTPLTFHTEMGDMPVYHTNVVLSVGTHYAVVGTEAMSSDDRAKVVGALEAAGKEIVEISNAQVSDFAGNMLELGGTDGAPVTVMSSRAFHSLRDEQLAVIDKHSQIVHKPLDTIEWHGGGSARCMLCEVWDADADAE